MDGRGRHLDFARCVLDLCQSADLFCFHFYPLRLLGDLQQNIAAFVTMPKDKHIDTPVRFVPSPIDKLVFGAWSAAGELPLLFCAPQERIYANLAEPFTCFHRDQPDVWIFFSRSSIPIFCGIHVTKVLIALPQSLSEISGIQRPVAICHEKINLDGVRCLPGCDQFFCSAF